MIVKMTSKLKQKETKSKIKNSKIPAKVVEETPWNKLCVDFIGPYKIRRRGKKLLILKSVTMIYPIIGWF